MSCNDRQTGRLKISGPKDRPDIIGSRPSEFQTKKQINTYIYIYREREIDRERERDREREGGREKERERERRVTSASCQTVLNMWPNM